MSDEDEAEVVKLRPHQDMQDDERMLALVPRSEQPGFCGHSRNAYDLDGRAQRAYCRECGQEVPLWEVLVSLARESERFIGQRKEARRRRDVEEGNLSETLRLEANAKARARKALSKLAPCACRNGWSGYGSAYWRFCPMCGGTRPSEAEARRERDRDELRTVLARAGVDVLFAGVVDGLAVVAADRWRERWMGSGNGGEDELLAAARGWVETRLVDSLVEVLPL